MIMNNEMMERFCAIRQERHDEFYAESVRWILDRDLPAGDAVANAMLMNCSKRLDAAAKEQLSHEMKKASD
ncbi:hypothetical protein EVB91_135 [Rhizobium phage RHph_I1_18]|nr:hypothetical protein EVB91_135 [Rhizobium phage RHph_I1_18]